MWVQPRGHSLHQYNPAAFVRSGTGARAETQFGDDNKDITTKGTGEQELRMASKAKVAFWISSPACF